MSVADDIIESMAKAGYDEALKRANMGTYPLTWEAETEGLREDWRGIMRAALAAGGDVRLVK